MSSYSQHFKASSYTPGLLEDLLKNWSWLFSNSEGNYVVFFILWNGRVCATLSGLVFWT